MYEKFNLLGQSGKSIGTLENTDGYKKITFISDADIRDIPIWFRREYESGILVVDGDNVEHWINGRIPPPYRQDIRDVLRGLGLSHYDAWEIFKRYKGKSVRDNISIEKIDE